MIYTPLSFRNCKILLRKGILPLITCTLFGGGVKKLTENLPRYDTNELYNLISDWLAVIIFDNSDNDTVPTR